MDRQDIEQWFGCRFRWRAHSRSPQARVDVQFIPLSTLEELAAHWQAHGWSWWPAVDLLMPSRYLKHGVFTRDQAGAYNIIYVDHQVPCLYHQFRASGTHYLAQHWGDVAPRALWDPVMHDRVYDRNPVPLVDIAVRDRVVYTATMPQIVYHFVEGTLGDYNLPLMRLVAHWQRQGRKL